MNLNACLSTLLVTFLVVVVVSQALPETHQNSAKRIKTSKQRTNNNNNNNNNNNTNCSYPRARDLRIFPSDMGVQYYSNIDLTQVSNIYTKPTNLIFSQHGADRNANDYYVAMCEAAKIQGYQVDENGIIDIIIVAARFMEEVDNPGEYELYWGENWKGGSNSIVSKLSNESQVSSFTVIDKIIQLLFYNRTKYYPNLKNITVAGHSAGGQFVQRYALVSTFSFDDDDKKQTSSKTSFGKNSNFLEKSETFEKSEISGNFKHGLLKNVNANSANSRNIKYVVANPSSFCYLTSKRWFENAIFRELTDDEISACPDYNAWKYGWSEYSNITFPVYITDQNITLDDVKERYLSRNVTYLQGTYDCCNSIDNSTCDDHDMDTGCEADLQGEFRLERGMNYIRSLREVYNKTVHGIQLVPFVGHDDFGMFKSPNGRRSIFSGTL